MDRADAAEGLSTRRLYAAALPEQADVLALDAVAAGHARVLRLAAGDEIELFDGRGRRVRARLRDLKRATVETLGAPEALTAPPFVGVVLCMPKAHKIDDVVRMTTEIGASALVLALSERSPSKKREAREDHKRERLERIAIEAARQSEQAFVPTIHAPEPLADALRSLPAGAARLALVERSEAGFAPPADAPGLWLAVGPEGGLSPRDREELRAAGFAEGGLGPSILRTETAAVVGVGLAMDWLLRSARR